MNNKSIFIPSPLRENSMEAAYTNALYWAVMFGLAESSFMLFAAHIKAPDYFFVLLAGLPCLLGPLVQILGVSYLEKKQNPRWIIIYSIGAQALVLAPLAALPLWLGSRENAGESWQTLGQGFFLALVVCYFFAGNFLGPAWTALIGVLVPSSRRADYFSRLSRGTTIISLASKLCVGAMLYWAVAKRWQTSLIFGVIFGIGALARFISVAYVRRMHEPPYERVQDAYFTFWQFVRRFKESNFVHFVLFISLIFFGAMIPGPFYVPYVLNTLHFDSWQWVVIDSAGQLSLALSSFFWCRFSAHYGNKATLKYSGYFLSLSPFFWLFSTNFYGLVLVNAVCNIAWAGFGLATSNYILEAAIPAKRARCAAYFSVFVGFGSFFGSMIGWALKDLFSHGDNPITLSLAGWSFSPISAFIYLLLISGIFRLAVCAIFLPTFKELSEVQSFSLKQYLAQTVLPMARFVDVSETDEEE